MKYSLFWDDWGWTIVSHVSDFRVCKYTNHKKTFQLDAYRSIENCTCFSLNGHHQMMLPGGGCPNEKVWTDLQWSPSDVTPGKGGSPGRVWCRGGGEEYPTWPFLRGSYHVTYPMMNLMLPPVYEQTDTYKNITFPQLRWRAIKRKQKLRWV